MSILEYNPPLLSEREYAYWVLRITAWLGLYGILATGLGYEITLVTFMLMGLPALIWMAVGFLLVPYLTAHATFVGLVRAPRATPFGLLVPLVGLAVTPVVSNKAAYGVPVPWLSANVPFPLSEIHVQVGFVAGGFVIGAIAGIIFRCRLEKPSP